MLALAAIVLAGLAALCFFAAGCLHGWYRAQGRMGTRWFVRYPKEAQPMPDTGVGG